MNSGFGSEITMPERDPRKDGPFVLRGRWQVVDYLGQGGMGTVYLARDLNLDNRKCVVKKLRDDFFREEDKAKAQQFFLREATVLAKLQHPNIVLVLDSFQDKDDYYLVMEYVEGHNLHDMLKEREEPFSEEQVLIWARQVCEVLHYLHANDPPVIYRDLKPSNIMIDTKDRVKLVDFGIARLYQDEGDNTHVVSQGYSPPEQYWGGADPRSDIYALGATMYFLLTGKEPLALTVSAPRNDDEEISEATDLIVQRATQQDVYLRYQSAADMKEELDYVFQGEDKTKPSFRWLELVVGVLVTFLSVGAWFAYSKFVEMRNDTEIQKNDLSQEKLKLEQAKRDLKEREDILNTEKKKNQEAVDRMNRAQAQPQTPFIDMGGVSSPMPTTTNHLNASSPTEDTSIGAMFAEMSKKVKAQSGGNMRTNGGINMGGNRNGRMPVFGNGNFGGPGFGQTMQNFGGGQQMPGPQGNGQQDAQPLMDRDENQVTDQEGLSPMEEDTQR